MESPWAPLRRRAFFILWLAQLGSNIGTWMQTVGAQWFLVEAGSSATVIALVQTASMVPALLLSLHAGVLADAFDRRKVLVTMNALAAVTAIALTVVTATGGLGPTALLVFTFLIGTGIALSAPAWQAIQPELVPRHEIASAAALGSVTINAARAVGPALAGILVAWAGPAFVFGINGLSFVAAAVAIYFWRRPATPITDREHVNAALLTGVRYIRSAPHIRRILLRTAFFVVPASALWALLPVAAGGHLGLGAGGYGLLLGSLGVGALLGVVVLPQVRRRASSNAILAGSAALFGVGTLAAAFLPGPAVAALLVLAGAAWIGNLTTFNAAMQLTLSPWVRARGLAGYMLVMSGAQALGSAAWGVTAGAIGYQATLAVSGLALVLLIPLSIARWPLPSTTGKLDRTIEPLHELIDSTPEPPDPTAGPVTVRNTYLVDSDRAAEFVRAMDPVRLYRLRTGATTWRLTRSVDDPTIFTEQYALPAWRDLIRQEQERTTGEDHKLLAHALEHTSARPTTSRHLPA